MSDAHKTPNEFMVESDQSGQPAATLTATTTSTVAGSRAAAAIGRWTRFMVVIPAAGLLLGAATLVVVGALWSGTTILEAASHGLHADHKELVVNFVEIADMFLLAIVLYIIALGLYELFIGEIPGLPKWLVFKSLDDLKKQLIGVVVVVLAVFFLGRALHGGDPLDLLYMGGGSALVIGALSLFLRAKH